jgi:virginiamycin B lyase
MKKVILLSLLTVAMITSCGDSSDVATSVPAAAPAPDISSQSVSVEVPLSELGSLSGSVDSTLPFQAAQIYAMNIDKDILYMVYTANGRYEAVNMLPGTYEVSVRKFGLTAPTQTFDIQSGESIVANFSLQEGLVPAAQQERFGTAGTAFVDFDELFPPGAGYENVEGTCLSCHNPTFFGQQGMPDVYWDTVVDRMVARGHIREGTFDAQQSSDIAAYLTSNFGLDSTPRAVPADFPLDEEALSRAMYIEYYLPLDPVLDAGNTNRRVQETDIDQNGNVWFTERISPNRIGKLDPRTGEVTDYVLPDSEGDPHGLNIDRFGQVWWAETDGFHLGVLDPATGEMTRYNMNAGDEKIVGRGHTPYLDSKDNVWFSTRDFILDGVESEYDGIGVWDRESGEVSLYMEPKADSRPYGLLVDVNDLVWTALSRGCGVSSFDPTTEEWTQYFSPSLETCAVRRLGVDSTASTIWFGIYSDGKLGRLDIATGTITEWDIPMFSAQPYDTWLDPEDKLWLTDGGQGGAIISFEPDSEKWTYYPSPQFSDFPKFRIAGDGVIWYPARSARRAAVGALYPDKDKMTSLAAQPYRYQ